ncbi:transposase [Thioclava sp. NG1]|uniref:DDE-type integrase/transposase/recombinase n=1 Tax=Thioclava sp. NG1 TaxID=2182426 RepID=UPI000D61CFD4|nr:DDE-type integrase/transposase/recombinase [Thioclava sp. NG1]PWE49081.1 transposase [Thioclava sp. NG1]
MIRMPPTTTQGRVYFGAFDRVEINGVPYQTLQTNEDGYVMRSLREIGGCEMFTHADLKQFQNAGRIKVEVEHFAPERAAKRRREAEFAFAKLTEAQRETLAVRLAWCQSFLAMHEAKRVSKTHASVEEQLGNIQLSANRIFHETSDQFGSEKKQYGGGTRKQLATVSSTSLLNWVKNYSVHGLPGLLDKRSLRGNRSGRFSSEVEAILRAEVAKYLHPDCPSKHKCIQDTQDTFRRENNKREADGEPPLPVPSKETIRKRILAFSPFEVCVAREGRDVAAKKFHPVGGGLALSRPLERVEMDDWTVDLLTIARHAGLEAALPPELLQELALDGKKKRWHLCVAICRTTRCIVGMSLSNSAPTSAAIQCLKMVVRDKGKWADAVGALDAWDMAGRPDLLVTDCGSQFASLLFQMATQDLSIDFERAAAGLPQLRATIERLFRTVSTQLIGRLSGRTFSDVVSRGDYPAEERAVLTLDDFTAILIRWVVDVYHNTPHEGLGGETPRECWRRLAGTVGVRPCPDARTLRLALGERWERTLSKQGLRVLNLYYNSALLMEHFRRNPNREVSLRWLADDIGQIEVLLGEEWHTVPAVLPGFDGRSAVDWIAAQRLIRKGNPHERNISMNTVTRAIAEIDEMNRVAGHRAGLLDERLDAEAIEKLEQKISMGFVSDDTQDAYQPPDGLYGDKIETPIELKAPERNQAAHIPSAKRKWKF